MTALLIGIVIVVLVFAVWGVWEYTHAVDGYETRDGYGPVAREHSEGWADHLDDMDWSEVRHGGLH